MCPISLETQRDEIPYMLVSYDIKDPLPYLLLYKFSIGRLHVSLGGERKKFLRTEHDVDEQRRLRLDFLTRSFVEQINEILKGVDDSRLVLDDGGGGTSIAERARNPRASRLSTETRAREERLQFVI